MTDSSHYTEKMIFGSDTESDVDLCDDSNVQDRASAASAVCSGKKRAVPEMTARARLNLAKKRKQCNIMERIQE